MPRPKAPTHQYYSSAQSIQKYIDRTSDYIKVGPVDQERSIYFIAAAKGDGSYREFAAAAGTSAISISRILRGNTVSIGHDILAGFAAAAESSGAVDLDMLMEAQGWIRKEKAEDFWIKENNIVRQIITDELLSGENVLSLVNKNETSGNESEFTLKIKEANSKETLWFFETQIYPLEKNYSSVKEKIHRWLDKANAEETADRHSLVIDNEFIFKELVKDLSKEKSGRYLSVILVSIQQRKIVDEYILPPKKGRHPQGIISKHRLFHSIKAKPPKKLYTKDPDTIIPQLNCDDCRRIISDSLLQDGFQVQYEGRNPIIMPCLQINPDVVMDLWKDGRDQNRWVFNIKSFPKKSDNSEALQYVDEWLTKTMAYYFQGGYMSRFTLVLDNRDVFDAIVDKLKYINISGEISLLLISPEKNKFLDEFIIPQKYRQNDLITLM